MNTIKRIFIALACCCIAVSAFSQDQTAELASTSGGDDKIPLSERLYYSGGLDLRLGNITVIGIYPAVGYKITTEFSMGLGLSYQYTNMRAGTYIIGGIPRTVTTTGSQQVYGGKIFSRFKLPGNIFINGEYETLNIKLPYYGYGRKWYGNMLVGGGYSMPMGGSKTSVNLMVLYNLNRSSDNALYRSSFVPRVEFAYNF